MFNNKIKLFVIMIYNVICILTTLITLVCFFMNKDKTFAADISLKEILLLWGIWGNLTLLISIGLIVSSTFYFRNSILKRYYIRIFSLLLSVSFTYSTTLIIYFSNPGSMIDFRATAILVYSLQVSIISSLGILASCIDIPIIYFKRKVSQEMVE